MPRSGPWARPLIIMEQEPQIPSRQSWSKAIGSWPAAMSASFNTSNISRNDMSGLRSSSSWVSNPPRAFGPVCRQTRKVTFTDAPDLSVVERYL